MQNKEKTAIGGKIKLTIALALGIMTYAFVYLHPGTAEKNVLPPAPQINDFLIGGLHNAADRQFTYLTNPLNFNLWHSYLSTEEINDKRYPVGWVGNGAPNDKLFTIGPNYVSEVQGVIQDAASNNMKVLLQRPKIEYLCYGQRSDYQCEPKSTSHSKWFYSFNDNQTGTLYPEPNGDSAIFCTPGNTTNSGSWAHGPGYVCKRLKANTEQSHRETGDDAYRWDSQSDWFIKPKIRIDPVWANNSANWLIPVCSVTVKNQDGNIIKNVVLKVRNFLDAVNYYDGNYKETYKIFPGDDTLIVHGDWGDKWWYTARGTRTLANESDTSFNHADIQVYWYGFCDMWIDYVRVDNDIADRLLRSAGDADFEQWLQWEAQNIACYNSAAAINFYVELVEFNNLPCIKYVNERLNTYQNCGKQLNVITDLLCFYQAHVSWNERGKMDTPQQIKDLYMDYTGAQEIFLGDPYPLIARKPNCWAHGDTVNSQIPSTLPTTTGSDILANIVSAPSDYDAWLQGQIDTVCVFYKGGWHKENHLAGVFSYLMKSGNEVSKLTNKPFYAMLQAHQWIGGGEVDREPTVEEQDMMTNLAVSYGAKGIIYWGAYSFYENDCKYNKSYWEYPNPNVSPRDYNVYGQPKWDSLIATTTRLEQCGPTLMSFDNTQTNSYIYRFAAERNLMYQNSYFYDIYTYKPGTAPYPCVEDYPEGDVPPVNTIGECKDERYLQIATFKQNANDVANYFMILNKRCSPHKPAENENGGRRLVKVYFDQNAGQLERYENWKITNISDRNHVITYVKGQTLLDFGWFEPGEGKIFKMEPVMISGGELAGDENISGESFTCEAPVYNNGFNITIGANTTIHFNDSSKFVMTGGVFTMGDQNTSAPQNITSDAVTGSSWSGHSFTNCEVKIYGATFTGLANDTTYAVNIIDCPVVDIRNSTFNTNSSLKGGINAVFFSDPNNEISLSNIYIGANTFNSSGSTIPTVNISSYAGETTPLIIENNSFNEGNTAIFLSGITGGAIKGNAITDNFIGINALTSSVDIKSNTISSTVNNAIGIFAAGGSELKMNNAGSKTLGGLNDLSNSGTAANNIVVDGSVFLFDGGQNIFNITDDQTSKHLYGYFPQFTQGPFDETDNCFKLNSSPVDPPYNMVT